MSNVPTLLRVGLAVLATAVALPACSTDTDAADRSPDAPAATIEAYVEAYNAGDIDGVMALFSEESEVIGSPLDPFQTANRMGWTRSCPYIGSTWVQQRARTPTRSRMSR